MSETTSAWVELLGGEVKYKESDNYRTRCLHTGSGSEPPLILLHGIGGHAEAYLKNMQPLAERLQQRDIFALDLIGHGFSSKPGAYGLQQYAEHVEEFVHSIGHETAHIYGESLGGWITTWIAVNRPELVETIGLNTTAGIANDVHRAALSPEQIDRMEAENQDLMDRTKEMIDAGFSKEFVQRRVDWLFHADPPQELVDIRYQIYQEDEVKEEMPAIYAEAPEQERFGGEQFQSIEVPTLIIHTSHNPGTPADTMRYIHDTLLPDSEIHVYEESAHWPQWEEPSDFNYHVAEFIRSHR